MQGACFSYKKVIVAGLDGTGRSRFSSTRGAQKA